MWEGREDAGLFFLAKWFIDGFPGSQIAICSRADARKRQGVVHMSGCNTLSWGICVVNLCWNFCQQPGISGGQNNVLAAQYFSRRDKGKTLT
mmetsp:Transcript_52494/g.85767  ORF Transcript_52494/g.85767 Transcript_52494/m.85767 type:complete len:92 (+) Transcript_52494:1663-1938(+)